jgi:hypothetical protein
MTDLTLALTPLLVLLILALFRFTGCKPFGSSEPDPAPSPTSPPAAPPPPATYETLIGSTVGFAAHWRLNETGGNVAAVLGALSPAANGKYVTGMPAGSGLKQGQPGVMNHKDSNDFAPEFDGTAAYVEVPFNEPLNPLKKVPGFSIELWVKPNPDLGTVTQVVISSHRVDTQQGYEIALVKRPNEVHQQIRARVFSSAAAAPSEVTVQPPSPGDPKEWRYIVMTFEGAATGPGKLSLYVRLAKAAFPFLGSPTAATYDEVTKTNPATLRFGSSHRPGQNDGNFFAGRIDEVAFYNGALAPSDIASHFNWF